MAIRVSELVEWLNKSFDNDGIVAIDEDGLSLIGGSGPAPPAYLEVGGKEEEEESEEYKADLLAKCEKAHATVKNILS